MGSSNEPVLRNRFESACVVAASACCVVVVDSGVARAQYRALFPKDFFQRTILHSFNQYIGRPNKITIYFFSFAPRKTVWLIMYTTDFEGSWLLTRILEIPVAATSCHTELTLNFNIASLFRFSTIGWMQPRCLLPTSNQPAHSSHHTCKSTESRRYHPACISVCCWTWKR